MRIWQRWRTRSFPRARLTPSHSWGRLLPWKAKRRGPKSTDEPVAAHLARSGEANRGREADAPTDIPARGWKDILWRTYEEIGNDRLLAVAGGVTFYLLRNPP